MRKIKVLIVDDSVVIRKIVSSVLSEDPDLEVVGTAANGKIALQKIHQLNPDILTLDVEMPVMDGLETLSEAKKIDADLPIIMFSSFTERAGKKTIEALMLGAFDYVTKPSNSLGISVTNKKIQDELIPKIKEFCFKKSAVNVSSNIPPKVTNPIINVSSSKKIDILAIGASTGGPNALAKLLPTFSNDFPVPIVIVQHMPSFFTKLLAKQLSEKSHVDVFEAKSGDKLYPGKAWIAPGEHHMIIEKKIDGIYILLNQEPKENSCRPSIDPLFKSISKVYEAKALSIILTGMGQDGLFGCQYIKEAGGQVIVQDKNSSIVWGMPGVVSNAGLADQILPLNKIGETVISKVKVGR